MKNVTTLVGIVEDLRQFSKLYLSESQTDTCEGMISFYKFVTTRYTTDFYNYKKIDSLIA